MALPDAPEATLALVCIESLVPSVNVLNVSEKTNLLSSPPSELTPTTKTIKTLDDDQTTHDTAPTFILQLTPGSDDNSGVDDSTLSPGGKAFQPPQPTGFPSIEVENTTPGPGCPPGLEEATVAAPPPPQLEDEPHPAPEESPESATTPPQGKVTIAAEEVDTLQVDPALYSLDGLDPLESFILAALLPDELRVHDLSNVSGLCEPDASPRTPATYVRVLPKRDPGGESAGPPRIAHLYLRTCNRIGSGHHGAVFAAPMRLALDAATPEQSVVRVAAKTAFGRCGAHKMLHREALMYSAFPPSIMEARTAEEEDKGDVAEASTDADDSGNPGLPPTGETAREHEEGEPASAADAGRGDPQVALVEPQGEATPSGDPTAEAGSTSGTCHGDSTEETQQSRLQVLPPVVPKFYGYYKAVDEGFASLSSMHPGCNNKSVCDVPWPTRILLLEECGTSVHPSFFTREQRTNIVGLLRRLHEAGFMQGSAYARNFLVQPGPLTVPRPQRSMEKPSFRIIDFGRGEAAEGLGTESTRIFCWHCEEDVERAEEELYLY